MSSVAKVKRNSKGQYAGKRSPWYLMGSWVFSFGALELVWLASRAVMSDFGSFRSCSTNSVLQVNSCGKSSLDVGDFIMIGLLVAAAILAVSLMTNAWRVTRRKVVI